METFGQTRRPRWARLLAPILIGAIAIGAAGCKPADLANRPEGAVNYFKIANSSFDGFTRNPTTAQQTWMREHYARVLVYSTYFDSRTAWYPKGWMYKDLYAIYPDSSIATLHPEWILKDAAGNNMYIPYDCSGGTCTQFAGISGIRRLVNSGSPMPARASLVATRDCSSTMSTWLPIDPRTRATMTMADYRRYMAEFLEEIRAAFPGYEIAHNAIWYAGVSDPSIRRQIDAADYYFLERGVNDGGIRGGTGQYGFQTFLNQIDYIHGRGKHVVFSPSATSYSAMEYGLASYLLVNDGADLMGNHSLGSTPDDWWAGNETNLGRARSPRYLWNGVWRRDFVNGSVLVNEPEATTKTVALGTTMTRLDGSSTSSVSLGAAAGVVLRLPA